MSNPFFGTANNLFRGRSFWIVTAILAAEIALFYSFTTHEYIPSPPALKTFASSISGWQMAGEWAVDPDTQRILRADDALSRSYTSDNREVSFFVALYKSQRAGATPHSPKVCLPGNGWTPENAGTVTIAVPGQPKPLTVNRYVVRRGEYRSVVLYWFQFPDGVLADEYVSRAHLMLEGLRYHRSDEAMVRVIAPVRNGNETEAQKSAVDFVQAAFAPLQRQIWPL